MKTNYVLVDYENVHLNSLVLLKGEQFRVKVFLGPKNTKLPVDLVIAMQEFGSRGEYIVLESPGSNALDFHIAYYLGVLAVADPAGFFHIISKDTGFDPLVQHLKTKKIFCSRSASIEAMPYFAQATSGDAGASRTFVEADGADAVARLSIDEMIKLAVDDLIKRKASKPRTPKTLRSTVYARCGKHIPAADIDAVCEALVARGYVKLDGTKVTYKLPAA